MLDSKTAIVIIQMWVIALVFVDRPMQAATCLFSIAAWSALLLGRLKSDAEREVSHEQ